MVTRLIIARHGNTFEKGQTPTRVGARTDLPLVETERSQNIGRYLKSIGLVPSCVYAAPLKRTMQTAEIALRTMGAKIPITPADFFTEIDYGPDENQPEETVIARIGQKALDNWNEKAIVPEGWIVNPEEIMKTWIDFGARMERQHPDQNILVVSSNGIIRFAPCLTGDFEEFAHSHEIKVGTGCLCMFEKGRGSTDWLCSAWNLKPKDFL
ncbi:MAG: histidine phosphatase family protein [Alphaproteobacteria bacterium]